MPLLYFNDRTCKYYGEWIEQFPTPQKYVNGTNQYEYLENNYIENKQQYCVSKHPYFDSFSENLESVNFGVFDILQTNHQLPNIDRCFNQHIDGILYDIEYISNICNSKGLTGVEYANVLPNQKVFYVCSEYIKNYVMKYGIIPAPDNFGLYREYYTTTIKGIRHIIKTNHITDARVLLIDYSKFKHIIAFYKDNYNNEDIIFTHVYIPNEYIIDVTEKIGLDISGDKKLKITFGVHYDEHKTKIKSNYNYTDINELI